MAGRMYTADAFERPPIWAWIDCISPLCGHSRAVPLAPWRIRWGVRDPAPMMRRHFRCGVCGRTGCHFRPSFRGSGQNGACIGEDEPFPHGEELIISGKRLDGESYEQRDIRVTKEYLARYPGGDAIRTVDAMCNLYSVTKGTQAIRQLLKTVNDLTNSFVPLPAVFPNKMAPIIRYGADGDFEMLMARWGFPPPNIPGSKPRNPYLTNVRNTDSRYWQTYLKKPEQRWRAWQTAMNAIEKKYGRRWRWHDIRAAFITHVALTMGGIVAQKLARHADFDTTQGYIDVADEIVRAGAEMASERPALALLKGGKSGS